MTKLLAVALAAFVLAAAGPAAAWGDLGHRVAALIAYRHLTPAAKARLDALLASDPDPLTAPDFASRATWADKYREGHPETAAWHFVDIEIDHPDLAAACFGFPALAPGQPASAGPAQDCVVDKVDQFEAELARPTTAQAERLLALKFLIHFVGDLHQPLHAADHEDRGGNCVGLSDPPDDHARNLHAWWDSGVVETLGGSAREIAARLDARISPAQVRAWPQGNPRAWAMETFQVGARDAYALPLRPSCGHSGSAILSMAYQAKAQADAAVQLEKAGVRLATMLNQALR